MTGRGCVVSAALAMHVLAAPRLLEAQSSIFTSIQPADCRAPSADVAAGFEQRGLGPQECRAPAGWRLFVVASDSNTWLEIQSGKTTWSSEEPVVYETPIGLFPSVGAPRVEWRRRKDGRLAALIFRVAAHQESDTRRRVTRLFVVRLEPTGACLLGRVRTNEEARTLADGARVCTPK